MPPASVGPMARPRSDAVPTHGKGCVYQALRARLVRSCTPEKPKMSSYSSHAGTPTGLPDDPARGSRIKVKTSLRCCFGTVSMQRQQETFRHPIYAPAVALLLLLHLFGCWYLLFQASQPREGPMGLCRMAKPLPGGLGDFWVQSGGL